MKRIKKQEESRLEQKKFYLPMNFNDMLNYLFRQVQHLNIKNDIIGADVTQHNRLLLQKDLDNFNKLFHLNSLPDTLQFYAEEDLND